MYLESDGDKIFDILKLVRWGCPASHHDTKCALARMSEIEEWLHRNNKYRILVTGKMGSGKTTFIRGLTEDFVPSADGLLPHTTEVSPYDQYREGSNVIFFDTPGLKDDENSSNDYTYLREMVRKNGEPNLLVFAIRMDVFDFLEEDMDAIVNISSAFGRKIWQKSMFILTFANMVKRTGHSSESIESKLYFSKLMDKHHLHILEVLRRNSVKDEVINTIPVVAVGLVSEPNLAAHKSSVSWIDDFWEESFNILKKSAPASSAVFDFNEYNENDKVIKGDKEESLKDQIFTLLCYVFFIVFSGLSIIRGFFRVKAILEGKWLDKDFEFVFILWSVLSTGVTLYSGFERLSDNTEIAANEGRSYLSLFLSFFYSIWFIFTSGFTAIVLLIIGGNATSEVPGRQPLSIFCRVSFCAWIILASGNIVNISFEYLMTRVDEEEEVQSMGSYFVSMILLAAYYCWSIFALLFSHYELYKMDYGFLYAKLMTVGDQFPRKEQRRRSRKKERQGAM